MGNLEERFRKLEDQMLRLPQPPPPPPKSLLSSIFRPFKPMMARKTTKQDQTTPSLNKDNDPAGLNAEVVEAIIQGSYRLRPVVQRRIDRRDQKRDHSVASILARRASMGYDEDEDETE